MKIDNINMVYFIGVGGIGMSALARFFNISGKRVAGYDLTPTALTGKLEAEGIEITYSDYESAIPGDFATGGKTAGKVLVVYTPAIPKINRIFQYFSTNGYTMVKRSELLGMITNDGRSIAVAGTHGKTSVCTMTAHLLMQTVSGCNAFLGGVARNYENNLLISRGSDLFVVEADEYDRSFLQLYPHIAIVTSMDPDHLDIYGSYEEMAMGFNAFAGQVKERGLIICREGVPLDTGARKDIRVLTYGLAGDSDYFARNIKIGSGGLPVFNVVTPEGEIKDLNLGVPGRFNVENAVAAIAAALNCGADKENIRKGLKSFRGINRRFDVRINIPGTVLIDDYAHHPQELDACISAVREIFPERKITGIFQPHLYTRTRDFYDQFAESLGALDELVLLDIYPAREEPLEGVTSELIFSKVKLENKIICSREQLPEIIDGLETDVVLTLGAGNIDAMVEPVRKVLSNKNRGKYEET